VEGDVVTVVMPVYDTPVEMLERAIDSILGQTFAGFEFLIVDDGSRKEETRHCLMRRLKLDERVRVTWEPHGGVTRALNTGLRLARGGLIARQDADDWSEPERLEVQVEFFREHRSIGLCGTAAWTHQRNGRRLWLRRMPRERDEILAAFWGGSPFVHGSVMFRRDLALSLGGYRDEFVCAQDYDFLWRLTETAGAANLDQALYHYRYTGGSVSAHRAAEQARACRGARTLALARRRGEPEAVEASLLGETLAEERGRQAPLAAALKEADHSMLSGEYGRAFRAYVRLIRGSPGSGLAWAKLARWGMFVAVPPMREACFR
jgi:glycosyltransferase involved in cell wall biosynthesis